MVFMVQCWHVAAFARAVGRALLRRTLAGQPTDRPDPAPVADMYWLDDAGRAAAEGCHHVRAIYRPLADNLLNLGRAAAAFAGEAATEGERVAA